MVRTSVIASTTVLVLALIVTALLLAKAGRLTYGQLLPNPPLKSLAQERGIALGNFAMTSRLTEKPYAGILASQFDFVLADNTPNWYFTDGGLRPSATTYNFKQMDQIVQFASTNHMPIQAHHFVWGEEKWLPAWLKDGNYTPDQLRSIMHDHIAVVGSHYKGRIQEWTVVNEAFTRNAHVSGLHDWWADHIGDTDYIDSAFVWAHQADPAAKLILNDFDNESINTTSNAMYSYLQSALARGVPVHGIGMQMHIDGSHPPKKDEVIANMKRFKDLGLQVYVTEFDVNMHDVRADAKDREQIQAAIYYDMMRACIESDACHSFAFLGITDKETWYNYIGLGDAAPLMFDEGYRAKPAFYSTRDALKAQ